MEVAQVEGQAAAAMVEAGAGWAVLVAPVAAAGAVAGSCTSRRRHTARTCNISPDLESCSRTTIRIWAEGGAGGHAEAAEGTTVRLDPEAADKAVAARAVAVLGAAALGAAARVAEEQVVVAQAAAAREDEEMVGEALGEAGLVVEEWEEAEAAVEGTVEVAAVAAVEELPGSGNARRKQDRLL